MEHCRQRGFVLLSAMLMLVMLAGILGLLTDTAHLQYARQRAQTAADAAAISAFRELELGNTAGMIPAAAGDAARNGVGENEGANVEVNCPPLGGDFIANPAAVEVKLVYQTPTLLMRILGPTAVTVAARAVAIRGADGRVTLGE